MEAEGKLFANALEIITDVHEEPTCLLSCKKNPDCKFLTHYSSLDVNYPGLCVLQKELSGPLTACEHCRTGSSDCSDITDSSCSFVVGSDKTPVSSFMFTDSAGGKGSGLDLSSITLQKFSITPGEGGSTKMTTTRRGACEWDRTKPKQGYRGGIWRGSRRGHE